MSGKIQVDDSASGISYSGSWQTSQDSRQYSGTSHYTTQSGATATLVFTGASIKVSCTNPAVPDGVIRAEFILDGKVTTFSRTSHLNAFYNDHFFFAGGLQQGQQHTLVVKNTGTQVPLHLDVFEIENGNVLLPEPVNPTVVTPPPPRPTTTTPRPTPTNTATRTVVQTSVVSSVQVVTRTTDQLAPSSSSETDASSGDNNSSTSATSESSSTNSRGTRGSGSSLPASITDTEGGNAVVTAFQIVTTSISGVAVVTTVGPGEGRGSDQGQALSIGAIVGIIIGCLFFLAIIGILIILLLRNRRKESQRRSLVRQRMAGYNATPYTRDADRHDNDPENQSTEGSSVTHPPPRLSLDFMRTLNEKSRPLFNGQQPPGPDHPRGDVPQPPTASTPNDPSAPSFRSSYPLTLPDAAPPAYTARFSVAGSSQAPAAQPPVS